MTVEIFPITENFAAEVGDVDLSVSLNAGDRAAIEAAFNRYSVLVFPDQHLSEEQHLDFARNFGPLARLMFATPASVVRTSLRALGGRVTVIPGIFNKLAVLTMRLMPRRVSTWLFGSMVDRVTAGD